MKIGMDVGSTTLKCVAIDDDNNIVYKAYERHYSKIAEKSSKMLSQIITENPEFKKASLTVSGSAGMGFANALGLDFIQEVYATRVSVSRLLPGTDAVIELGGEDAKILFFTNGVEVRMNGSCAGGTGAFIDQMASLLGVEPLEMNTLAETHEKIYSIASRCGVFAKSDIQPLLNQGARKNDVAASIFTAVVNQTVSGLSQGRRIEGNVVYLGGPLYFLSELRKAFDKGLGVTGVCPENGLYFVALGAAYSANGEVLDMEEVTEKIRNARESGEYISAKPLFTSEAEYKEFSERHAKNSVEENCPLANGENVYIGIDAGSTTVKAAVINKDGRIVMSRYMSNNGDPVSLIRDFLVDFYNEHPNAVVVSSAVTGYGEDIIKNAFGIDIGIVETVAHFTAAKRFKPDVDFIIDIGGQDIKCFKIRNNAIDNIFLNEACSSGCGSFLQTFAAAWGYDIDKFSKLGIYADKPVDLGSRCTVFMNSSVKQAQKDGASIENISAGLSISVVKNAIYKVIRAANADELGKNIVVQGGTFLNDAVLRAFEQEIGRNVVRPTISGLMGAYGAALYSMERKPEKSTVITPDELKTFEHKVKAVTCGKCSNNCRLTVNTFSNGRSFIGGNRCSKPIAKSNAIKGENMFDYKRELLSAYKPVKGTKPTIGLPMGLNMFELLPFWHKFFTELGFGIALSEKSSRDLYVKGQHTIPSDTVCYPAKLLHGHIESLMEQGVKDIFYPCMSYNLDENLGDNNYNCPVVAYYPEVIRSNVGDLKKLNFMSDYVGLHRPKDFSKKIFEILSAKFDGLSLKEVKKAAEKAYAEYYSFMDKIHRKGMEYLADAKKKDMPVIVLCGRPYHLDEEINHGIDKLICECGATVITEDSVSPLVEKFPTTVLNQWTYHSRLYAAAKYVAKANDKDLNVVQLVSFGCGVDAITTDEMRTILEQDGKIYTQIKIDEISNPGAVKIRLRSLFAATGR
ncbi:MAG: acyl-CoA dehydratase activase-related protein [Acutalibacteraceae bacterium]|nr:acyl-CoA dehydratase activase-related protein [Acutalibacteraceae bacterium]